MEIGLVDRPINIKDLTIDIPTRRETGFNPKQDIFPSDWQGIRDTLENYRSSGASSLFNHAVNIKILDPEQDPTASFDQRNWDAIMGLINQKRGNSRWSQVAEKAVQVKMLSPTKFAEQFPNVNDYENMKNFFRTLFDSDPAAKARVLYDLKLLGHPLFDDLSLRPAAQEKLVEDIQQKRANPSGLATVVGLILNAKVLFEQNNPVPTLDIAEWDTMKQRLEGHRQQKNWVNFASLGATLALLSLPPLQITEAAIHVPRSSNSFHARQVVLPLVRKF
ncbi:hypothetical protein A2631_02235 [Candidatus Daviesbacteria bacterium RIFCSPHIGHO2_01_FULL_44_29]|uniref:Uncharacterized protein n=1 Tax=Candidatus Daviesbacteria bacterium RIFCSPHIGHO2_02_FULL_43_12 TaxID=1797776 RepID=A0A1F5KKR5_9BACT|nr:MAG: hypothetical protein A2631_02235 [Candidatus Daviesbacteria bacterium RIFCSPHIGHO2_01_FULL_44_29]OGE41003.1 MAG: hypothetical protein A3E86_03720 [Candidatus Daviesbacteria bacterium RIFCSPHIGHO2_12_FULL_47_45]OGE41211.1 MAG: hypothetical protein A3D25_01630 [Candidatus Daviesbacteria bacterium RIFCSPHIGHO2_02_FULL_43_12]OGE69411.1 MAG: hypothetical protein A3B55_03370 [Candidatus Daviesbacteria bacterium RIFCSPLOWO2_01_FULL_43_15]